MYILSKGLRPIFLLFLLLSASLQNYAQQFDLVPNRGQWDGAFLYRFIGRSSSYFIENSGFTVLLSDPQTRFAMLKDYHNNKHLNREWTLKQHALKVRFSVSGIPQKSAEHFGSRPAPWYHNYFLGNDPSRWKGKVPLYDTATLGYSGFDIRYYTLGDNLEYDLMFPAHAGREQIENLEITLQGADQIRISEGKLLIGTSVGTLTQLAPVAWQTVNGERTPVICRFVLKNDNTVKIIPGEFREDLPLIIDPVLVFSTYSGSKGDNFGFTATYDSKGNLYAGGIIDNSQGTFPVTAGAFQTVYGGRGPGGAPVNLPCDASISKYNATGSTLLWASYLGGSSDEAPHSLVVDEQDRLVVFGTTLSKNFPRTPKAFDTSYNGGYDLYLTKISEDGTILLAGTYIGGSANDGVNTGTLRYNYADDFRGDVFVDENTGQIYVATCTRSGNFPITPGAQQSAIGGGLEACMFSIRPMLDTMRWSTFYGGTADDAAYSIKLDDSGHVFVAGGTSSSGLKMTGKGYKQTYNGGRSDGFIARMNRNTGLFDHSSFWGTGAYDQIYFLDFDPDERIYITGQTEGNVARTAGTYGNNNTGQFIAILNNTLDTQLVATTFGDNPNTPELSPTAFMVDLCYNIYFSGWGSAIGRAGTTAGLEVTPNAVQSTTDDNDFYLYVMGRDAKYLQFASYFGGNQSEDHVDGGTSRFDKRGVIYQSVCSSCPNSPPGLNDFPTTAGAVFPNNVSYRCSNASFKLDFQITYAVEAKFTVTPKSGCSPLTVKAQSTGRNGRTFKWVFGDGNTATGGQSVTHTYSNDGTYKLMLIVIDSGSCNIVDTMIETITVTPGPEADFEIDYRPCEDKLEFINKSKNYQNPVWDMGDGQQRSGDRVSYTYASAGIYQVKLVVERQGSSCKDSLIKPINITSDPSQNLNIHNVFTPDNDGKNDCYQITGLSPECEEIDLSIYNRWGQLMWRTKEIQSCWNGRVGNNNTGTPCPSGTYYFIADVKTRKGKDRISGTITLIREP